MTKEQPAEILAAYAQYMANLDAQAQGLKAGDDDFCTAKGGSWITIKGNHICILEGETPKEAFERQTGKKLEGPAEPDKKKEKKQKPLEREAARPKLHAGLTIHDEMEQRAVEAILHRSVDPIPQAHVKGLKSIVAHESVEYKGERVVGLYYMSRSHIEIDKMDLVAAAGDKEAPETLYHEIGHHVYDKVIKTRAREDWRGVWWINDQEDAHPTGYSSVSAGEGFAEAYSSFLGQKVTGKPGVVKRGSRAWQYFEQLFKNLED